MSLYQLHRCVFDFLRAGEVASSNSTLHFDVSRYELTTAEKVAFEGRDIAGLYRLGLHPVLLNAFCRAVGFSRDAYRTLLAPLADSEERTARWQK